MKVQDQHFTPFGEEMPVQAGLNSKKFTGHERDLETGLDYMKARFYEPAVGRFMSPDPLLNSGQPWDAESWNRYSYVTNNPMRFNDPLGLYVWGKCSGSDSACEAQKQRFRNSIAKANAALKKLDPKSKTAKALAKALKKLGEEGKGNVKVNFGNAGTASNGQPLFGHTFGNSITINYAAIDSAKSAHELNADESEALDAGVTAHEGTHAGALPGAFGVLGMRTERAALFTESATYEGLSNTDRLYGLWNESWRSHDEQLLEQYRSAAIQHELDRGKQEDTKGDTPK